jgi:hypothetical protein
MRKEKSDESWNEIAERRKEKIYEKTGDNHHY